MNDYETALKDWQRGRNAPGVRMPEAFRITPMMRRSPEHVAALARLPQWTRERFDLPEHAAILAAEIACAQPGCPPLETVVVFWTETDKRHQFKVSSRRWR